MREFLTLRGQIEQRARPGEFEHFGIADVDDVRRVRRGQRGHQLRRDAVPRLRLHMDLGAGLRAESCVDGVDRRSGEVVLHDPDGDFVGARRAGDGRPDRAGGRHQHRGDAEREGERVTETMCHGTSLRLVLRRR